MTRSKSGREAASITIEAVLAGEIGAEDVRIHPDQLRHQAEVAHAHANPQLAANLERAAELASFEEAEVLALYESLRPGRSSHAVLLATAQQLSQRGAVRCAELFQDAAEAYRQRGLSS